MEVVYRNLGSDGGCCSDVLCYWCSDVVEVEDLRQTRFRKVIRTGRRELTSEYIMIFQVSTGRSASLKLQSKGSGAMGSSEGSW